MKNEILQEKNELPVRVAKKSSAEKLVSRKFFKLDEFVWDR